MDDKGKDILRTRAVRVPHQTLPKEVVTDRVVQPGTGETTPTTPMPPVDAERYGPSNIHKFDIYTELDADVEFKDMKALSINRSVYRDDNINAGYYYYLPNEFNLYWDGQTGDYGIHVNYGVASEGQAGRITVTAILVPDYSHVDWEVSRILLKKKLQGKPEAGIAAFDLVPMPFARPPGISFDNLYQFGVSESDIAMRVPPDLTDPILLSFTTNRIEELMNIFLNDVGLFGDIIIYPAGETMPSEIRVPFNLKIDSPKTYGRFTLQPNSWRNEQWRNSTDFPIILTHLHILKQEANGQMSVYSWKTGDVEVPEKAMVSFNTARVPAWVDTDPKVRKMWLEYSVKRCASCNIKVEEKIDKGVSGTKSQPIEITNLNALASTGGAMMKLYIRSIQANSSGREKKELPVITILEDPATVMTNPLYLSGNEKPDYEYKVKIYRAEGEPLESNWIKSTSLELFFNRSALEKILPQF
jgi:hypothetical protein